MKRWELHLTYIVLWATSIFVLWGIMTIDHERVQIEIEHRANLEPYALKMEVHKLVHENRGLYREIANIKQGRG